MAVPEPAAEAEAVALGVDQQRVEAAESGDDARRAELDELRLEPHLPMPEAQLARAVESTGEQAARLCEQAEAQGEVRLREYGASRRA